MPPSEPQAVGIFVSQGSVRVAVLEHTTTGVVIRALRHAYLPASAVESSGLIRSPQQVAEAVRQALHDVPLTTTAIRLACGGDSLVLRTMRLAPMDAGRMREAIRAEIEHYSFFSLGEEVIGYQAEAAGDEETVPVTVAATNRQLAESADQTLLVLGAQPGGCELAGLAAARAALCSGELTAADGARAMLLMLGSWGTEAVIVGDGRVLFSHVLDLRLRDLLASLQPAAAELLAGPEAAGPGQPGPADALAAEAGRCLRFFQRETPGGERVGSLLLVCDADGLEPVCPQVGERLGVPCRELNPTAGLYMADAEWPPETGRAPLSSFAPAIGAALGALGVWETAFSAPLSVVQPVERRWQPFAGAIATVAPAAAILGIGLAIALGMELRARGVRAQEAQAEQRIEQTTQQTLTAENLTPEQKLGILATIEAAGPTLQSKAGRDWPRALDAITSQLPPGITLESVEAEPKGTVQIKGLVGSEREAAEFAQRLSAAPGFKSARVSALKRSGTTGGRTAFEIVAQL